MVQLSWRFIVKLISNLLIVGGISLLLLTIWPTLSGELWYWWRVTRLKVQPIANTGPGATAETPFGSLAEAPTPLTVEPVSRDFGIIIEKIGVNAPVVENVPVTDASAYREALNYGVAHAVGSAKPGGGGNVYLFAHSSLNFWQLGKYATVFNLLRKLETGERITLFYQGHRYDYIATEIKVVSGFDTSPLYANHYESTLTLQTCYPPGSTLNRLIVTATLEYGE